MAFRCKSFVIPTFLMFLFGSEVKSKVYERCELALELRDVYEFPLDQLSTWICIANYESHYNTSAFNPGSGDHGLFQISELFWCSPGADLACAVKCTDLKDDDIEDDVVCAKRIFRQHTRISGNGFTAWVVYNLYCNNRAHADTFLKGCFNDSNLVKSQQIDGPKPGSATTAKTTPKSTEKQSNPTVSTKQVIRGNDLEPNMTLKEKTKKIASVTPSTFKPTVSITIASTTRKAPMVSTTTTKEPNRNNYVVQSTPKRIEKIHSTPKSLTFQPSSLSTSRSTQNKQTTTFLSATPSTGSPKNSISISSTTRQPPPSSASSAKTEPNRNNYVVQSTPKGIEKIHTTSKSSTFKPSSLSTSRSTQNKQTTTFFSATQSKGSPNSISISSTTRKPPSSSASSAKTVPPTNSPLFRILTTPRSSAALPLRSGAKFLGFGNSPSFHGFNSSSLFDTQPITFIKISSAKTPQTATTRKFSTQSSSAKTGQTTNSLFRFLTTPKLSSVSPRSGGKLLGFGSSPAFQGINRSSLFGNANFDKGGNIKPRETRLGGDDSIQLKSYEKLYSTINKPDYRYTITSHGFRFFRNV